MTKPKIEQMVGFLILLAAFFILIKGPEVRYYLIQQLAGDTPMILNAKLSIAPRTEDMRVKGYALALDNMDAAFMSKNILQLHRAYIIKVEAANQKVDKPTPTPSEP